MSSTPIISKERERSIVGSIPKELSIGGSWRGAIGGKLFAVEDPSTGETLCEIADADVNDGRLALDAAAAAQRDWAKHPPRERGEILRRAFQIMTHRLDDLALLMTLEMGKPLAESRLEVAYAADFFRWFSEEAVRIDGRFTVAPNGQSRMLTLRQPAGPCLLITPWNFPLAMGARKIAPAIAAGCTMIIKPAELTPLSTLALAQILEQAGLPPGVLNVITTSNPAQVAAALLQDDRLRKLSFTGSTEVGRQLVRQSADGLLRVSMELGGNAPFIVFEDADIDAAVEGAITAKMRNMGEACTAANRFYAAEAIAEEFTRKLADRLSAMKVGRGTDTDVQVGPLIEEKARNKVVELVQDALANGAEALLGGVSQSGPGYFYPPTVLTKVPPNARLLKEEIFGPVAPIVTFQSEEEVITLANDTEFGLVAYLFTQDLRRAFRVSEALETGMVGLNQGMVSNAAAPFGGIKHSGFGREGGLEGIEEYLETKYIAMNLT